MPDWKKLLADQYEKKHSKDPNRQWATYARQGWDRAEEVAEALDCGPHQLAAHLRDLLKEKRVERGEFLIWNRELRVLEKVIGFRKIKPGQAAAAKKEKPALAPKVKPAEGMTVLSRRGLRGKIRSISRGKCEIEWESGTTTRPSLNAFKKRDIRLET